MRNRTKPELMSPAGYWPQLRAAVEAGADSVYFGLKHFTARAKSGFALAELPEVMRTLHARGVKGFVTFNTLVFDHELREAARVLAAIAQAGADAVIVQDIGAARMAKTIAPSLALHASTQMSVTDGNGVRLAEQLGASRVTLARELSLEQIRLIQSATGCELEIFVHGALCVAYSGQCFSSEAWGGRSANRGQCAQACRLAYDLEVDGVRRPLGDARYLLSPGDLYTLRHIPEIVDSGIAALKIEGRYKDAEYVALVTDAYRRAIDDAWEGRPLSLGAAGELRLEQVYSRGMGPFFLTGTDHQAVVRGRSGRHRGVLLGKVTYVGQRGVIVAPESAHAIAPLKPGDGVVFDAASWRSPQESEEGGRVFEVLPAGAGLELRFGNGLVNLSRIRSGDWVWRTEDADVAKAARPYLKAQSPVRRSPVNVRVSARAGAPLVSEWQSGDARVAVESAVALEAATGQQLTADYLRAQLGRLGGTAYELAQLDAVIDGNPFTPASVLNTVRREAVAKLAAAQVAPRKAVVHAWRPPRIEPRTSPAGPPLLHLLVRTPEQLEAALTARPNSITLDYLDLYGLKPSIERVRAAGIDVRVATPRVLKPDEDAIVRFLVSLDCPLLVRPAGLLAALKSMTRAELTGDFSLNATNAFTAQSLFGLGIARLTPGYDLNAEQVSELARHIGAGSIEAVVYQHLPVFHTEHCVFARFLSSGTTHKDCGRPCERHTVALRDERGHAHPVLADTGCRNTVFGAEAQHACAHMGEWLSAGIRHFRVEFAAERAPQVKAVVSAFAACLAGRTDDRQLLASLSASVPDGITEGSYFVAPGYRSLPVLD